MKDGMKLIQIILFSLIFSNVQASPCLDSLRELFSTKVHSTPKAQTITLTQGKQYNVYHRKFGSIYEDLFFAQQTGTKLFFISPKGRTLDFHIHEVKIAKSWANHFTHKKQGLFRNILHTFYLFLKIKGMNLKKYPFSFRKGRITAYSRKKDSQRLRSVVQRCNEFDQFYEQLGFQIPNETTVTIAEHKLYDSIGPLSESTQKRTRIDISPMRWRSKTLDDPSVLLHERAHLILSETFGQRSSTWESPVIQESLADFLAATYLDSPVIGREGYPIIKKMRQEVFDIRNIEHGSVYNEKLSSIASVSENPHINSVFISTILWRVSRLYKNKQQRAQFALEVAEHIHSNYSIKHYRSANQQAIAEIRVAIEAIKEVTKDLEGAEQIIDSFVDEYF